jgi:hypothetical protein
MWASTQAGPDQPCSIGPVVDMVFSRWTTPILWTLNNDGGRVRFVELQRLIGTITAKVLTQRLRQRCPLGSSTRSPTSGAVSRPCSPPWPTGRGRTWIGSSRLAAASTAVGHKW